MRHITKSTKPNKVRYTKNRMHHNGSQQPEKSTCTRKCFFQFYSPAVSVIAVLRYSASPSYIACGSCARIEYRCAMVAIGEISLLRRQKYHAERSEAYHLKILMVKKTRRFPVFFMSLPFCFTVYFASVKECALVTVTIGYAAMRHNDHFAFSSLP